MFTADKKIQISDLKAIPLVPPDDAREYWSGIKHSDLIQTLQAKIAVKKWDYAGLRIGLSEDERDIVFALNLHLPNTEVPRFDSYWVGDKMFWKYSIGVASSNSRRRGLTVFYGLSAGDFHIPLGTLPIRKHTSGFSLADEADSILEAYWDSVTGMWPTHLENRVDFTDLWPALIKCCTGPVKDRLLWSKLGLLHHELSMWAEDYDHAEQTGTWTGVGVIMAASKVVKTMPVLKRMDVMLRVVKTVARTLAENTEKQGKVPAVDGSKFRK